MSRRTKGTSRSAPSAGGCRTASAVVISVIVPHLNQAEALARCLLSISNQSYPQERYEVIVVDNGSTIPPYGVIARFPEARMAFEYRPGPGPARNRGIAVAGGDICAFIDADCTAHGDWLAVIAERLGQSGPGTILGGDVRIARDDTRRPTALEAYESVFAYRQKEYIERHGFSGTGNLAAWRADVEAVGPFAGIDEAEDRDWGQRACAQGRRVVYVPDMVVYHPARRSFDELARKWDRHVGHDYTHWFRSGRGRAAWLLRSVAIAASAIIDGYRVLCSRRVSGVDARLRGLGILVRIRLYRARRMVQRVLNRPDTGPSSWNRPSRAGDVS